MKTQLPPVLIDWFCSVADECLETAEDAEARRKIYWKVEHTTRVVRWGAKIMENQKDVEWNYQQGLAACLLHDVGRFPQALRGTFEDKNSINHAQKGKDIFDKAKLNLEGFTGSRKEISEAIGEHNNPTYNGENIYVKLVRDADQLAILEELDWQVKSNSKLHTTEGIITKEFLKKFNSNQIMNTKDAQTMGEWMLCIRSWERHFNFPATRIFFNQERFGEKLKEKYYELFPSDQSLGNLFLEPKG